MEKVKFKDLSGWLKFGAIISITLGIIYILLISGILVSLLFFS